MGGPPPKGMKAFNYQQSLLTSKKDEADVIVKLGGDSIIQSGRPVRLKNKPTPQYKDDSLSPISYHAPKEKPKMQKLRLTKKPELQKALPAEPLKEAQISDAVTRYFILHCCRSEQKHDNESLLLLELRSIRTTLESQQGQINDLRLTSEKNPVSTVTVAPIQCPQETDERQHQASMPEIPCNSYSLSSNHAAKKRSRSSSSDKVGWYVL